MIVNIKNSFDNDVDKIQDKKLIKSLLDNITFMENATK